MSDQGWSFAGPVWPSIEVCSQTENKVAVHPAVPLDLTVMNLLIRTIPPGVPLDDPRAHSLHLVGRIYAYTNTPPTLFFHRLIEPMDVKGNG